MNNDKLIEISEELWDKYSEYIDDNLFGLERVAGTVVLTNSAYNRLINDLAITLNIET